MPLTSAYKASPALITHIEWVRARLNEHRRACATRDWSECQLRDVSPRDGTFDPVSLGCAVCETQIVLFKRNEV